MLHLFCYYKRYFFAGLLSASLSCSPAQAQAIDDTVTIMERVRDTMASISDYSCMFSKHELVGDRIFLEDNIILKVKRPDHFYLKWTKGTNKNRVAIYVEGRNNNKILLHLNGLLGLLPLHIDPAGKEAFKENRHSITEADFVAIADRFLTNCRRGLTDPECVLRVRTLKDPDTLELEGVFPREKGYYAHIVSMTVDSRTWLPTGLVCYGWDNEFLEEYHFDDIKINPGLTESAFERDW